MRGVLAVFGLALVLASPSVLALAVPEVHTVSGTFLRWCTTDCPVGLSQAYNGCLSFGGVGGNFFGLQVGSGAVVDLETMWYFPAATERHSPFVGVEPSQWLPHPDASFFGMLCFDYYDYAAGLRHYMAVGALVW